MKLFLASEAKHPTSFTKLDEFVGGLKNKSIAYIPTAANADGWDSWKDGGSWQLLQSLDAKVAVVQLEDFVYSSPLASLRNKDIIWVGGGQCGYLMYWMRRLQIDKHIREILHSGCVYVGSSAGSMITAKNLDIVEWYIGEKEHGASVIPGLGLVDFDIYPHYEDGLEEEIRKEYHGKKLFLLKNGEAVMVEDGNVKVFGEERIVSPQ